VFGVGWFCAEAAVGFSVSLLPLTPTANVSGETTASIPNMKITITIIGTTSALVCKLIQILSDFKVLMFILVRL
jgi:hypothetical protein